MKSGKHTDRLQEELLQWKLVFGLESLDRDSHSASSTCGFNTRMFHGYACHFVYCKWLNRASEKTKAILLEQTVSCSLLMYSVQHSASAWLPRSHTRTKNIMQPIKRTVHDSAGFGRVYANSSTSGFAYILGTKSPHNDIKIWNHLQYGDQSTALTKTMPYKTYCKIVKTVCVSVMFRW